MRRFIKSLVKITLSETSGIAFLCGLFLLLAIPLLEIDIKFGFYATFVVAYMLYVVLILISIFLSRKNGHGKNGDRAQSKSSVINLLLNRQFINIFNYGLL